MRTTPVYSAPDLGGGALSQLLGINKYTLIGILLVIKVIINTAVPKFFDDGGGACMCAVP